MATRNPLVLLRKNHTPISQPVRQTYMNCGPLPYWTAYLMQSRFSGFNLHTSKSTSPSESSTSTELQVRREAPTSVWQRIREFVSRHFGANNNKPTLVKTPLESKSKPDIEKPCQK